ncbi:MAG: cell surface protein SprA [Bacteroidetes bacterium]|nr:cell surface protein SprA [Bacteroidota bacterium]
MSTVTPQAGYRKGIRSSLHHVGRLFAISATSLLVFLGASVEPVFTPTVITIEAAMEWNAYVQAGLATAMNLPGRPHRTFAAPVELSPADPSLDEIDGYALKQTGTTEEAMLALIADTGAQDWIMDAGAVEIADPFAVDLELESFAHALKSSLVPSLPLDSLDIPPVDSTARAKFLPPRPRPSPVAPSSRSRVSPLYLQPSRGIQHVIEVDSARNEVLIREVVNGKDVRVPLRMSLEDYIRARYNYERDMRTAEKASEYTTEQGDPLQNLLKNITEIDIPIAPNPLMSIFGDRSRISVRINGTIDINAGFKIETSDQQSVFLQPTQFSPNFKQQVQINVNGLVGDKLSIRADWSTERTFDYENQLKIKYTGYEDEIIQSVEAGNVSLQTPSTLIQGSGALFGIKAEFQAGPLRLATIASQKKGEASKLSLNGGAQEQQFERHAFEYSDSHYFIEAQYRDRDQNGLSPYEAYYNYRAENPQATAPVVIRPDLYIKDIEVWLSRPTTSGVVTDPEEREVVAFIDIGDAAGQLTPYRADDPDFPASYVDLLDPNKRVEPKSGEIEVGKFKRIQRDVDFTYNPNTGIITLNQSIQDDQVIAVAYRIESGNDASNADDLIYGTFASDQRIKQIPPFTNEENEEVPPRMVLKLVKPKNLGPSFEKAWKLKVRSIYSLNTRNLTAEDLANFKIVYRNGGQPDQEILPNTNAQLIRLFGLDYTDDSGGPPDGKIDFLPGLTVNPARGEIIFPTLEPWDAGMKSLFRTLYGGNPSEMEQYAYPEIYTQTKTQARQSSQDKIVITGQTRGSASTVYNLGFNVVPGSVRVLLNGSPLTPGVDYTVDEQVGTVRITKEEALVPEAKVDIEYEKQDLFTFASKTLLGARGEVDLGQDSYFGFTWMSLNQKTLSDKVRIGEEPISNSMFGIDAKTTIDAPVLTEALNTLPFLSTKEKSTLTLQGEAAMVMPQASSKTSTIPSDGGEGIAYLDDFEGSRIFIPLQTAYSVWRLGSVPPELPATPAVGDSAMQSLRAKLDWYNIPITSLSAKTVRVDDIWPDKSVAREDQRVTVLDLDFYPQRRGQYNYTPDLGVQRRNWAGMMRLLPVNATNLVDGNFNYIEMWMRVENNTGGKLIIDLGKISEDVIPNGKLNSEDDVLAGSIRNGILNPGEDVGLDMLTDDEERALYADQIAQGLIDAADPSGDNFAYDPNNWTQFNGTQGNIDDPAGQFPDTEDLNNNSILDLANDFYRYVIDLDTTRFNNPADPHPFVVGGGTNGWYQFRIPLMNPTDSIGSPALDNVEYMRVLLNDIETTDPNTPVNIRIAEFNFVGNQWYERVRNDPMFAVSVVNIEDNPGEYTTPPGVIRPRDRTRPDQEIYGNEQSLSLDFTNLPQDSLREAYRLFPGNGIDLFNYRQLKMYVHGDQNLQSTDYELVMRFGIDTANYYEYRALIEPGWSDNNEVAINFAELTAVKNLIDSVSVDTDFPVRGKNNAYFWVKGNPDVVRVQFMSVGVRNRAPDPITGRVWINELRVIQPNTKNGYAYNASMNLRLADIADVSATINHSDPYFHSISERFSATRAYTTNWSLTTTLNLDKALPEDWKGTQMRVTYTHAENLSKPLLVPGQPDVEVEAMVTALADRLRSDGASEREVEIAVRDARIATQTLTIRDSWAIPTVKLKVPGESWLIQDIVNRLELSYNYSITRERNTIFRSRRNWQWQARIGYGYDFGREAYVKPFSIFDGIPLLEFYKDAKWFFLPSRISGNATLERSRTEEVEREPYRVRPYIRSFTHNRAGNLAFTLSEESLLNLSGSYGANMRTSLLGLETTLLRDENGDPVLDQYNLPVVQQRQSSAIFNDIFFGRSGSLYFGIPTNYQQQFSLQSRPLIPPIFDLDRYLDLTMSYQVSYNWQQNIQQAEQGRNAGYNATFNGQINLKLKSMFDPLFSGGAATGGPVTPERAPVPGRRSSRSIEERKEEKTAKLERAAELKTQPISDILAQLKEEFPDTDPEFLDRMQQIVEKERELAEMKRNPQGEQDLEAIVSLNDEIQSARRELIAMMTREAPIPGVTTTEDSTVVGGGIAIGRILREAAYYAIKLPFLDYDNIGITYTQSNASQVGGVRGETGFSSFWTSVPFGNPPDADLGPSRLYQLGLISDPNPASGRLAFKSSFPFIGIEDYSRGLRAPNPQGTYADNYTQSNSFSIKTNRPLWEGARLDLNWDLRWSINKNYQLRTDENGVQTITSTTTTGKLERSFMAFPDFFLFSLFNTNMNAVNERYQELLADPTDTRTESELLAQAFEEGFEAVPWLSGILGSFFPRLNYGFRWDGLEKWSLLEGLADRISLEHRYTSNYSMSYRHSQDDGTRITDNKQVSTGFKPLIGVQLAFNQVWGGDLSIQTRWDKQGSFGLNTSASNIVEDNSDEFTVQAEFKKSGFEMPFLGVSLKNDIQFTFAFSLNKTSSRIYSINDLGSGGQPREGITRISLEPRVRYSISQRVQASLFYRYQRTRPDAEVGSRIPGTTSHEGGLEVRITIAGS